MNKNPFQFQPITKKNILIFVATVALYTGLYLGNRGVVIFGEFLLLTLIGAFVYSRLLLRRVVIKREHYPRTFQGSDVFISLRFQTTDPVPHYLLEGVDTTPPADRYHVGHLIPGVLAAQDEYVFQYRMHCTRRRGVYTLGPIRLGCADPLGIFSREYEAPVFSTLLVYPRAENLQFLKVLRDGTLRQVGIETILTSGQSEEFIGVREYVRGDPPGKVHWKLSAHHRKLIVKEFKENTLTDITIFLDTFRLSMTGIGDVTSIEYVIRCCAAIARYALDKSHRVEVIGFGKKTIEIPLGGGFQHLLTILDQLTFLEAGGEGSYIEEVVKHLYRLRRGSTAIFIFCVSSVQLEQFVPILRRCTIKNIHPVTVIIDDKSFIKFWREQERRHASSMSVPEMVSSLLKEGCDVYAVANRDDIKQKLATMRG